MTFDINKAARIMRVGHELSETNRKLKEAAYSFIEWMFQALEGIGLPGESFGWIFRKNRENQTEVSFKLDVGGWHNVTTNKESYMSSIVLFCQALAGPEGERLLAWLEEEVKENSQLLLAVQEGIGAIRSSIRGSTSS
jgi:hypothetical protein